jgi:hypothetical protein
MGTEYQPDSVVDDTLIEVKRETDAVSTIRSALLKLAYAVTDRGQTTRGILLVIDPKISDERLDDEEKYAKKVLEPGITKRLGIVVYQNGELRGLPDGMPIAVRRELGRLAGAEQPKKGTKIHSGAAFYEIFKILVHQWLLDKGPMTAVWLANTAGCTYPTVATALQRLGSTIKRHSDRRIELAHFPREEWAQLVAVSNQARSTARFADRSGQPRSTESLHRRMTDRYLAAIRGESPSPESLLGHVAKLELSDIAVGGVFGAKHYYPSLDLTRSPRVDLTIHGNRVDWGFVERLDPALKRTQDQNDPANLVVHFVRRHDSLFDKGDDGVNWADPVECLLDLHEMKLESQAREFLNSFPAARGKA